MKNTVNWKSAIHSQTVSVCLEGQVGVRKWKSNVMKLWRFWESSDDFEKAASVHELSQCGIVHPVKYMCPSFGPHLTSFNFEGVFYGLKNHVLLKLSFISKSLWCEQVRSPLLLWMTEYDGNHYWIFCFPSIFTWKTQPRHFCLACVPFKLTSMFPQMALQISHGMGRVQSFLLCLAPAPWQIQSSGRPCLCGYTWVFHVAVLGLSHSRSAKEPWHQKQLSHMLLSANSVSSRGRKPVVLTLEVWL